MLSPCTMYISNFAFRKLQNKVLAFENRYYDDQILFIQYLLSLVCCRVSSRTVKYILGGPGTGRVGTRQDLSKDLERSVVA